MADTTSAVLSVRLRCTRCRCRAELPYTLVNGLEPTGPELRDQMRLESWAFNSPFAERPLTLCPACFSEYARPTPSAPAPAPQTENVPLWK